MSTDDNKHFCHNRENLQVPIKKQFCSNFWNLHEILNILLKKHEPPTLCISEIIDSKDLAT